MEEAKQHGLYTAELKTNTGHKFGIYARTAADAKPLEDYIRRGGRYGTPEFSRLLGYSAQEVEEYRRFLQSTGQAHLLDDSDSSKSFRLPHLAKSGR